MDVILNEGTKKLLVYFWIQTKNQQNRIKIQSLWRFYFEPPIKTQVNMQTYPFFAQEQERVQIDVDPGKFKEFRSKTAKP